jgi:hypothetical protein
MIENSLFYPLFISQIFLFSYYFPKKIHRRMQLVLKNYPASMYPKLYPKPIEHYYDGQEKYRLMNQGLLYFGIVSIISIFYWDFASKNEISSFLPWTYFMLQMFPLMLMEFSGFSTFKQMRKTDKRTTRMAELNPRRIFDYISPSIVVAAVILYLFAIIFDIYKNQDIHQYHFTLSSQTVLAAVFLTLGNIFFIVLIFWQLSGKKLNPYQSNEDRIKQIEVTIKSSIYVSMWMSLFFIANEAVDDTKYEYLQSIIMSLYCQLIAIASITTMLKNVKIENINFDVYKADN